MFRKKFLILGLVLVFVFALSVLIIDGKELDLPKGLLSPGIKIKYLPQW